MKNLALVCLVFFLLSNCTEIPVTISDVVVPTSDKAVLIEELTGVSCVNCPKGALAIKDLTKKFPNRVYTVGIHGPLLSTPIKDKSKYDFRTPASNTIETSFFFVGKPASIINRVPYSAQAFASHLPGTWESKVAEELNKPHELNLFAAASYDATNHKINFDMTAIPLKNFDGNFTISVYVTENKIIDAQASGNIIVEDYEHNHVLRAMMTSPLGDFFGTSMRENESIRRPFSYTLTEEQRQNWKIQDLEVIVMVANSDANNRSVIQCTGVPVKI